MMKRLITTTLALLVWAGSALAEDIRLATYNVEHFQDHFSAAELRKKEKDFTKENKEIMDELKKSNDEDNWETAQVIADEKVNPDIIAIEECCNQTNLDYFNKRWLKNMYQTVIVFPTNTEHDQHVGMMLKPGFNVLEKKDQYYQEKDPVGNARGKKLFARGPSFVKVQAPSGYVFWVGVTHQKSKSGNSGPVTAWRNREAVRTHQIMKELQAAGPDDVVLLGDMNDELGEDREFEHVNGGDSFGNLIGPAEDKFILATKPLVDAHNISYGGYWVNFHRSIIDHIILTPSMKDRIVNVNVYHEGLAPVASDHYPVILTIHADAPSTTQPTTNKTQ